MKAVKKENLPVKICVVCQRPFTWRKKWQAVWDEVKYCSDKCKKNKHPFPAIQEEQHHTTGRQIKTN